MNKFERSQLIRQHEEQVARANYVADKGGKLTDANRRVYAEAKAAADAIKAQLVASGYNANALGEIGRI